MPYPRSVVRGARVGAASVINGLARRLPNSFAMLDEDTRESGQRSTWRGTLGFGLVSIPVALHRATADKGLHFHDVHDEDGGRIRRVAVCSRDGKPVAREHIVHDCEIEGGRHVQITDAELASIDPPLSRSLVIEAFVDPAEIDPTLYDRTYHLAPTDGAGRAYALLVEVLRARRLYGIARLTLRAKRRVAVVRPAGPPSSPGFTLALTLMGFADEQRPASEIEGMPGPEILLGDRELDLATRLVEAHRERFEATHYHDDHRDKLRAMIQQKAEGRAAQEPAPSPAPKPAELGLVGALEASLREIEEQRRAA
jgi:DNA end-binding protein Ku